MNYTEWFTLALVVITAFYAWATYKILQANRAVVVEMAGQTEAQLRPYITAALSLRSTVLFLEIRNRGKTAATDLRLTMDKDFFPHAERRDSENIRTLPAFSGPIAAYAAGARLQFILGAGHVVLPESVDETVCPKTFSVRAQYRWGARRYDEHHEIDLRPLLHSVAIVEPVAEEIKNLREVVVELLKKTK
jgi:hypothetical protein